MPKKYPAEVRERAALMTLDRLKDYPSLWAASENRAARQISAERHSGLPQMAEQRLPIAPSHLLRLELDQSAIWADPHRRSAATLRSHWN